MQVQFSAAQYDMKPAGGYRKCSVDDQRAVGTALPQGTTMTGGLIA